MVRDDGPIISACKSACLGQNRPDCGLGKRPSLSESVKEALVRKRGNEPHSPQENGRHPSHGEISRRDAVKTAQKIVFQECIMYLSDPG